MTSTSVPFCSRSFHPIRCDFVAAFSGRTSNGPGMHRSSNSAVALLDGAFRHSSVGCVRYLGLAQLSQLDCNHHPVDELHCEMSGVRVGRPLQRITNRGPATPDPGEMERVFLGSRFRKKRWLRGLATPDSCDWLKTSFHDCRHRTVALGRQRSHVRIVSGAPFEKGFLQPFWPQ